MRSPKFILNVQKINDARKGIPENNHPKQKSKEIPNFFKEIGFLTSSIFFSRIIYFLDIPKTTTICR
ncbi:hypothetical protein BGP_4624 [Beggiatoa sp. PS]|nr:hypothetical protein BGP_4624 [Beggiatoa sp. PS]